MSSDVHKDRNRSLLVRLLVFALILVVAVFFGWRLLRPSEALPVYHPNQLDQRLVDPHVKGQKGEHHISDFDLVDQQGRHITLKEVGDRIIVADFFFTTCATICPRMSVQMGRVQEEYKDEARLVLLSHSVTPEIDSVEVLSEYAQRHGADPERWHFLTGDRKQIYDLARRSYFAAMDEGDGGPDDFVHTENFVLVDPQRRLRGFYDGTSKADVDRLIGDIGKLLEEEDLK